MSFSRCWRRSAVLMLLALPAQAGGLSPKEARDRMVVPPGFKVEVFASEPEIRQPVAACFDERGRMWVIEYLQYPNPAGLVPVKVDQYLRTQYDRVPAPPPKGPRGADRIKILEDTDGDGKADKVTTFLEGLNLASAIAVGYGGVFVGQAPYLLFYPDRDRDDKPDGDPEVLLSGFGLEDAHATVNSLTWGPDGWLYGAQGSTVTARIQEIEFQQGIWRYHPKTKKFELFAEGGGNTWGVDFDRGGNLFGSSNGSYIAFHMVQGGNYVKGFAKHGPLHNPRAYGYFDAIPFTGTKPGGHVTPGGIIYKGEQFPKEYRGVFLGANLLSNSVYWYKLAPKGSSFTMTLGGTLLDARDPWFRPIDLLTGPDGSVYVVDWYDKRASHLDPRDTWDKSNGRIYKISYGEPEKVKPFDLSKLSTEELLALREKPNDWWVETARRILYERCDFRENAFLSRLISTNSRDEAMALRDLWALNACGGVDDATLRGLLTHTFSGVRRWAVRLIGDRSEDRPSLWRELVTLAASESDPTVRAQIASSCGRWSSQWAMALIAQLAMHAGDGPHLPLLMWWAVEREMRDNPKLAVRILMEVKPQARSAVLRREILPRMARALAENGSPSDLALCARLLEVTDSLEDREAILVGVDRGLEGTEAVRDSAGFSDVLVRIGRTRPRSVTFLRIAVRLGDEAAYAEALSRLDDPKRIDERRALIELVGSIPRPAGRAALIKLLGGKADDATVAACIAALGRDPDEAVASSVLESYPVLSSASRSRSIDALASRREWAAKLVAAIGPKGVPAGDLKVAQAQRIAAFGDAALTAKLEAAWGKLPGRNNAAKIRRIAEVRGVLPEGDKGVAARGEIVFKNNCAACHRLFGEGERIGPELTGAERGDLDFLLTSLVDPSAVVRKEYQGQTLALKDGRVLTGMVIEEDGRTLTLFDGQKQKTTIAKTEIEERKAAESSVMPEGLLDTLTEEQVRDLFRYLQSTGR